MGTLDARAVTAAELADAYRDLGQTRAALATTRAQLWRQTSDLAVTERRETIAAETADLVAEVAILEGEVEALRVILNQQTSELEAEIHRGA